MVHSKQHWYTPAEVAVHNRADDCWVSLNGKVLDLSQFLAQQFKLCHCTKWCACPVKTWFCADDCIEYCPCFKRGYIYCDARRLAMTIFAYAGKDVSHWFKGNDWVTYVHPIVGSVTTYHLHGHELRRPVVPSTKWRPFDSKPWWDGDNYVIGNLTAKTRPITITNTHTSSNVTLEVCSEETIYEIMLRYLKHNSHMMSYTWRHMGRTLHYDKTLEENGIADEREEFNKLGLPENIYIPSILIYYNDDLTEDYSIECCFCETETCKSNTHEKLCLNDKGGASMP